MTLDEAARALVAHPRWRWHHTMGRVCLDGDPRTLLPDLDDPATAGVLLDMCRQAWPGLIEVTIAGDNIAIRLLPAPKGREPYLPGPRCTAGDTLGHAAALALLALWGPA